MTGEARVAGRTRDRGPAPAGLVWRFLVPVLATAAFAAFALLFATDRSLYFAILNAIHVHPFAHPFLDTRFVTAQVECWQRGIDVYVRNPCDPLGRTLDYSPLWLRLPFLGRSAAWTPLFGLAIDLAFLLALFRMPWALGGAFDLVVAMGAVLAWATIFAAERGNTDLLMFAAAVWFAHLMRGSARARTAGYALVLAVGLLKFFPLTLLAFLVREPPRRMWTIGALCGLALLLFVACFHADLSRIGGNMANGLFGDMFGAQSLPFGVPTLLGREGPLPGRVLFVAMTGSCVAAAVLRGRDPMLRKMLDRLEGSARALLLVGAVLCVGCFFGHQNIGYRAVLLLLALPGLLALARTAPTAATRLTLRATALLVVLVLWDGIVSRSRLGWFVMQLSWWWIVFVLLTIAVSLFRDDVLRVVELLGLGRRGRPGTRAPGAFQ